MGKITVDGQVVALNGEQNLLEVIRKAGIDLPTFCYHSELSIYGACRMCLVEVDGGAPVAACSTPPRDGMVVETNTERLRHLRKMILELLLANHSRDCTTCEKNGNCRLQEIARKMGVREIRMGKRDTKLPEDASSVALVRDPNKCILCGDCVRMCEEVQGVGVLDFAYRGSKATVVPAFGKPLAEVDCVNCGQCASVCPTGAIVVKSQVEEAWKAIHDPNKVVVAQIAPAVRVAAGEAFSLPPGEATTGKIVAAMKRIGFDQVFDTCFGADLTVMEETTEFIERVASGGKLPLFTSCCPAWVKFAEQYYPDMVPNISSCRSPQQMFGSVLKKFYARERGLKPENLYVISVMPCTAKKFEARRPEFKTDDAPDVDLVLTTQEFIKMIQEAGISFEDLEPEAFDVPFGFASGAGVIFGATGGVAEAVLRAASDMLTADASPKVEGDGIGQIDKRRGSVGVNYVDVRGMDGLKEATVNVGGHEIKLAVVNGLGRARKLLDAIRRGEAAKYDLVEVMACPGGCVGGAGQPIALESKVKEARAKGLYRLDREEPIRRSQDNPFIKEVYGKWLEKPGSHVAHQALHTSYASRRRIADERIQLLPEKEPCPVDVGVCVGTSCYLKGSYVVLKNLVHLVEASGLSDRVNLHATFCLENCDKGPSVSVNDQVISGVTPERANWIFENLIKPRVGHDCRETPPDKCQKSENSGAKAQS